MSNGLRMSGSTKYKRSSAEYRGGAGELTVMADGEVLWGSTDTHSLALRIASNLEALIPWNTITGKHWTYSSTAI